MRLLPEQRQSMVGAVRRGFGKTRVAEVFDVWTKKRENKEAKITLEVELAIIAMRTTFDWGTARIKQGLIYLPDYATVSYTHLTLPTTPYV